MTQSFPGPNPGAAAVASPAGEFPGGRAVARVDDDPTGRDAERVDIIDLSDDGVVERAIAKTEQMIDAFKRIRTICLRLTNEGDWTFQGDGLYLNETGAQKIGIAWGVDLTPEKVEREDLSDEAGLYYVYTVFGTVFSKKLGRLVKEIGTCSSRDEFFGKGQVTDPKTGARVSGWKALDKVDITDVKKKAMTNFKGRAIKSLLGLGNVTVEELRAAGLDPSKIEKVDFQKGRKTDEANASPALKKNRGEIDAIAEFLANGDPDAKAGYIREATYFKSGDSERFALKAVDITTERWAETSLGRIKGRLREAAPEEYARRYPAAPATSAPAVAPNGAPRAK